MSGTGEGGLGAIKKIPFAMAKFLLTKNVCLPLFFVINYAFSKVLI